MALKNVFFALTIFSGTSFAATDACDQTYEIAAAAALHRDQGLTEGQLRLPLPPRESAAKDPHGAKGAKLLLMHQIVDELYLQPPVDGQTYATYKAEQCHRQAAGKNDSATFASVAPRLIECGKLDKKAKIVCAMEAAGSSQRDDA